MSYCGDMTRNLLMTQTGVTVKKDIGGIFPDSVLYCQAPEADGHHGTPFSHTTTPFLRQF